MDHIRLYRTTDGQPTASKWFIISPWQILVLVLQIRALVNLDSAGAGGREILFQGGPNHPWLMKASQNRAIHLNFILIAEP